MYFNKSKKVFILFYFFVFYGSNYSFSKVLLLIIRVITAYKSRIEATLAFANDCVVCIGVADTSFDNLVASNLDPWSIDNRFVELMSSTTIALGKVVELNLLFNGVDGNVIHSFVSIY